MSSATSSKVANDWNALISETNPNCIRLNRQLVAIHSSELATQFYRHMLDAEDASVFLSHDQVKTRLHGSLQQWLVTLFNIDEQYDLAATIALQVKIGEIHARIKIPMHLVLRGARYLKQHFSELLQQEPLNAQQQNECLQHFCDTLDMSMEVMGQAYASSYDRNTRSDEVYRLFSITQNLSTEREKQKGALLDWENRLMFECTVGNPDAELPTLGISEFGLWFTHKGSHAFQDYPETQIINERIKIIDEQLLVEMQQGHDVRIQNLRKVRDETKRLKFLLDDIFAKSSELESGRDVLTKLLNRKFLPTVLSREIAHARRNHSQFALLSLDIDYFKGVNDSYGHEAGDSVLQQLGGFLVSNSRAGDFVFRLGGEEFMIVLVDVNPTNARSIAENLRNNVAAEHFMLPNGERIHITISSGLACFNGHPDYQHILRQVDKALYDAKNNGRNRVIIADIDSADNESADIES
ncbi:diguanylate cyclase [Shewanella dokdonensis]|uniref:Diguanylate cyclase DosC n=1 Tax=Shewanella dokdonensis TaxID=712036 RepID=A0ABX8DIT7_9GAMM|nr:diguanylate cyclase [Shewanella dokdonensis]MCL1075658.1 diguanylate cyclase [Shewanella dokdonensis]QVK24656.1 diguanylate cyclase [Shewanella dokdonensis]